MPGAAASLCAHTHARPNQRNTYGRNVEATGRGLPVGCQCYSLGQVVDPRVDVLGLPK